MSNSNSNNGLTLEQLKEKIRKLKGKKKEPNQPSGEFKAPLPPTLTRRKKPTNAAELFSGAELPGGTANAPNDPRLTKKFNTETRLKEKGKN